MKLQGCELDCGFRPVASDAQLVRDAVQDRQLFWRLYERYADAIYWYALPRTGSAAAADDIVSETMLAAFEHLERFDPDKGGFATWLFVIARRKIVDRQRAHRRFWRYVRRHSPGTQVTSDDDLLANVLRNEEIAEVFAAYDQLTTDEQDILALRYSAGLATKEIAEVLGISDAAARQRLSRARRRIADELAKKKE
jgi:RNA polymerase sigma factor (sigma-70 family)